VVKDVAGTLVYGNIEDKKDPNYKFGKFGLMP
jgi:hypothetical protein